MTIEEMMARGSHVFAMLDNFRSSEDWPGCNGLLNTPQPADWVITKKSKLSAEQYQSNKIGLIEALMVRVFGWYEKKILSVTINQDNKSRFSATVLVKVVYPSLSTTQYQKDEFGVASVVASSIEHLELATPKAVSMAFKNACKNIGVLFGRDLNRDNEDEEIPTIQTEYGEIAPKYQIKSKYITDGSPDKTS